MIVPEPTAPVIMQIENPLDLDLIDEEILLETEFDHSSSPIRATEPKPISPITHTEPEQNSQSQPKTIVPPLSRQVPSTTNMMEQLMKLCAGEI